MGKIHIAQANSDFIKVAQITDTHIFSDVEKRFDGTDTTETFTTVINCINEQAELPDIVLVTGDLVHEPEIAAYERLLKELTMLQSPVFCIAGNHDNPEIMHTILNQSNVSTSKVLESSHWVILLLDSTFPENHSGRLQNKELEFLADQLKSAKDKHALICLHHPPVSIKSQWMDNIMLENPYDLFSIVDQYTHIRGILWGHIHQEFSMKRKDVLLLGSPSTCVQFKPMTVGHVRDDKAPGYRELKLTADGKIQTTINRVLTG